MTPNNTPPVFEPDYATPPGETLAEVLASLGMSQTDLARRMGRPIKTINEIIQGKAAITADTALELERVLEVRASTWCGLEANYREHLARVRSVEKLEVDEEWLAKIPLKAMQDRGWLPRIKEKPSLMEAVLRFFGVAGTGEWKSVWEEPLVAFRKSSAYTTNYASIAAWIRKGEIEGRKQECASYDSAKWRQALNDLRAVSLLSPNEWIPAIQSVCNACGVAYVFIAELSGCHASGATRWLRDDCALILQSGRHKDDGHFWFTFFHEARHVLQGRQKKVWTIDTGEPGQSTDPLEIDADNFAAEHLVPSRRIIQLKRENAGKMPVDAAIKLAADLGIAPGIVAGRLHHEKYWLPMVGCKLKKHFRIDVVHNTIEGC